MDFSLIVPAFVAGLITFLAPCTLPLIPVYLAIISGVPPSHLQDPERAKRAHVKIFVNGLFFVVGFSLVFILLGTLAGAVGQLLTEYRLWIARFGGILVILFGLFMLGTVKIPMLDKIAHFKMPRLFRQGSAANATLIGAVFGFGWTPCIGPVLGTILLLASISSTVGQGAFLLFIFSIGLAIPFLLVALLASSATKYIRHISRYLHVISVIGGIFLIALGILILFDQMGMLISYGYQLFDFINYEQLMDYL